MRIKINRNESFSKIAEFKGQPISINDLLYWSTENSCSDLYIVEKERPYISRFGQIICLNCAPIDQFDWDEWSSEAINSESHAVYVRQKTFDFSYINRGHRYRVNISFSQGLRTLSARMINTTPPKFKYYGGNIEYPASTIKALEYALSNNRGGMIIFSAPTGNGKTTTLGSCINSWSGIDKPLENANIITLEDPIEYIYNSFESTRIVQKELGEDFISFEMGIRSAVREHPTHIVIGELRDRETIKSSIEAGRSGHTLMSTFHTRDIPSTITRLLDNFSNSLADGADLVSNISLIVCQRLKPNNRSTGYILEVDYLLFNNNIKAKISEALKEGDNIEIVINEYLEQNINNPDICGREVVG